MEVCPKFVDLHYFKRRIIYRWPILLSYLFGDRGAMKQCSVLHSFNYNPTTYHECSQTGPLTKLYFGINCLSKELLAVCLSLMPNLISSSLSSSCTSRQCLSRWLSGFSWATSDRCCHPRSQALLLLSPIYLCTKKFYPYTWVYGNLDL